VSRIQAERQRYQSWRETYLRAFVVARSRFAEDALVQAVARGVEQYVVLGAGLDTFAFRNPYTTLKVFEVDHPATQGWKRRQLAAAGIDVPRSMTFVPVDFEAQLLSERLRAAGVRTDAPAFFSWLGVSMYLTREVVIDTLRYVVSFARGSGIVFDYSRSLATLSVAHRLIVRAVMLKLAVIGEPWRALFTTQELYGLLGMLGYTHVEDISPAAINARYFSARSDMLRVGGTGGLIKAWV
jgi:methyltransferase (TIGR00027 family)